MTKDEKKVLIGAKIKSQRCSKKITQFDLAEKSGISRTYLSDVENGRYMPSVEALTCIAKVLDIDLNFLTLMT